MTLLDNEEVKIVVLLSINKIDFQINYDIPIYYTLTLHTYTHYEYFTISIRKYYYVS